MWARLVRTRARNLDATWIGREMMVGTACGVLSDIDVDRRGHAVALYIGGQMVPVGRDDVAIYDTLGER